MKSVFKLVVILATLHSAPGLGQEFPYPSTAVDDDFGNLIRLSLYGEQEAFLQQKKISIGTILMSHHLGDEAPNETHSGIYFEVDRWSIGTYENSYYRESVFVTYKSEIYSSRVLKFEFVTGLADGYAEATLAQDDYMPILGLSAQMKNLKAMLIYDVLVFGLEFPMN